MGTQLITIVFDTTCSILICLQLRNWKGNRFFFSFFYEKERTVSELQWKQPPDTVKDKEKNRNPEKDVDL